MPYLEELAKHYRQKYDNVDGGMNWTDLLKVTRFIISSFFSSHLLCPLSVLYFLNQI